MKKLLYVTVIMISAALVTSCSKRNDLSTSTNISNQNSREASLSDILKAGPWVIDYYVDEDDKSADFTGYVFTFKADGSLILQKGNESYTGQW